MGESEIQVSETHNGPGVPLVVQVGFAGSRKLIDAAVMSKNELAALNIQAFELRIQAYLNECIVQLRTDLCLSANHFLCGISQVAIGADTLFTRMCKENNIPQRVYLPQHRDEYLAAVSTGHVPDFTAAQRRLARDLLEDSNVIQIHVASLSHEREIRFEQTNIEIARESDVVVCLMRSDAETKPGGSGDMMEQAKKRGIPVLEIRVSIHEGSPVFTRTWHRIESFAVPTLPDEIAEVSVAEPDAGPPDVGTYCNALKQLASRTAKWQRNFFMRAAFAVIGAHVIATLCAVIAVATHQWAKTSSLITVLVIGELLFLFIGFGVHQYLHHSRSCETWAVTRLVAELARSVSAMGSIHVFLAYLFDLPFPHELRPLLRTINVLHLRTTRQAPAESWETSRDFYVTNRLTDGNAQVEYYRKHRDSASRHLSAAGKTFTLFTVVALAAAAAKLLLGAPLVSLPEQVDRYLPAILGGIAIFSPVVAVASLSLSAAFDLEARFHTYEQMHAMLIEQVSRLNSATSEHEFSRLLLETESHLLGETANWFARRSFTGVS